MSHHSSQLYSPLSVHIQIFSPCSISVEIYIKNFWFRVCYLSSSCLALSSSCRAWISMLRAASSLCCVSSNSWILFFCCSASLAFSCICAFMLSLSWENTHTHIHTPFAWKELTYSWITFSRNVVTISPPLKVKVWIFIMPIFFRAVFRDQSQWDGL